ncbi:MAG: LysM peptidoglycan-binding domain-containing protein [Candidatus Dormibacteria bacterium]
MSSYAAVDANQSFRRARYRSPRVPRRRAARIKFGRVVLVLAVLWVVCMKAAYGGARTGTEQVTVGPGETVWSIASERYPDDDTRGRVHEIVSMNGIWDHPVFAGEQLRVPAR